MAKHAELGLYIQGLIRAEKARRKLTFEDISQRLREHGIVQTPTNLRTKLGRGDMSAQLFLALLKVLELRSIKLEELELRVTKGRRSKA
jgi:hypothetical protein